MKDIFWNSTRTETNRVAKAQGRPVHEVFDDSLAADIARFAVLRRLRKTFPGLTPQERRDLVQELTDDL